MGDLDFDVQDPDSWAGWNLSRERARDALAASDVEPRVECRRRRAAVACDGVEAYQLVDALPDGVVIADADGIVTTVNEQARRLLGETVEVGRPLSEVMALQDQESCDWYASNRPYEGLPSRVGLTEQTWLTTSGTEVLVTGRINRVRRCGSRRERGAGDPLGPRTGPARPRPLRPGRDRGARAAVAADRGEGLRRHPAEQVGAAQRRAEEADADHGPLRLRAALAADHRAARRGPDRHRPAAAVPPRRGHPDAGRALRRVGPGGDHAHDRVVVRRTGAADLRRPRQALPGRHQRRRQRDPARRRPRQRERRGRSPSRSPAC